MNSQTPFIKKITTGNAYYIYDVSKNEILPVDRITYDLIDDFPGNDSNGDSSGDSNGDSNGGKKIIRKYQDKYTSDNIKREWQWLSSKAGEGYFSCRRPEMNTNAIYNTDKDFRGKMFRSLILVPCDDCNLRCKYCSYTGSYHHNRRHKKGNMPVNTVTKALNRLKIPSKYKTSNRGPERFQVDFFGGEPLLNMAAIKRCKQEADRLSATEGKTFTMVVESNGTLLTPGVSDYLAASGIFLSVSLDGFGELHDKYRVFRNGKGSFDRLHRNLRYIKSKYPEYFKSITFTMVLEPPFLDTIVKQFDKIVSLIGENRVKYSVIDPYDTNFFSPRKLQERGRYFDGLREKFVDTMGAGSSNGDGREAFLKSYFQQPLKQSLLFMAGNGNNKKLRKNICFLGGQKALVDSEGGLTPCIEFWNRGISMGNLDEGLNADKLNDYTRQFCETVIPHCKNCWLIRHCQLCPPLFLDKDKITPEKREQICRAAREAQLKEIKMTLSIIEKNPAALNYLNHHRVIKDLLPEKQDGREH